jgi:hypothetical protein
MQSDSDRCSQLPDIYSKETYSTIFQHMTKICIHLRISDFKKYFEICQKIFWNILEYATCTKKTQKVHLSGVEQTSIWSQLHILSNVPQSLMLKHCYQIKHSISSCAQQTSMNGWKEEIRTNHRDSACTTNMIDPWTQIHIGTHLCSNILWIQGVYLLRYWGNHDHRFQLFNSVKMHGWLKAMMPSPKQSAHAISSNRVCWTSASPRRVA